MCTLFIISRHLYSSTQVTDQLFRRPRRALYIYKIHSVRCSVLDKLPHVTHLVLPTYSVEAALYLDVPTASIQSQVDKSICPYFVVGEYWVGLNSISPQTGTSFVRKCITAHKWSLFFMLLRAWNLLRRRIVSVKLTLPALLADHTQQYFNWEKLMDFASQARVPFTFGGRPN